jgi:hypothetical protein
MIRAAVAGAGCRLALERHQLRLLRAKLRLDPPPASTDDRKTNRPNGITAYA